MSDVLLLVGTSLSMRWGCGSIPRSWGMCRRSIGSEGLARVLSVIRARVT